MYCLCICVSVYRYKLQPADAKTNLERARYKQREIITANQRLRADNQALQKEVDELRDASAAAPADRKVGELIQELKDSNRLVGWYEGGKGLLFGITHGHTYNIAG